MSDIAIWRLHLKTQGQAFRYGESPNYLYDYGKLFDFCIKDGPMNGIVGVGWSDTSDRVDNLPDLHQRIMQSDYTQPNSAIKAINAISRMNDDDLVWTRRSDKQVYYLCRVTKTWLNTRQCKEHYDYDIANYVGVEWIEVGTEDKVPGKVVAAFRATATAQRVNDVGLISKYIWNKHSSGYQYKLGSIKKNSIWDSLHSESIEEIVMLYLQVCKGLKVYTSTVKLSEARYECIMVDTNANLVFSQVKSGDTQLIAADYIDIVDRDETANVYLFAVSQKYGSAFHKRIHCLSLDELERFIDEYRRILPAKTREWIEMYEKL